MEPHSGEHFRTYAKRVRERLVEISNKNNWPFPKNRILLDKQRRLIGRYERGELQPEASQEPEHSGDLPASRDEHESFNSWANRVRRLLTEISGKNRPYPRSHDAVNIMRRKIKKYQERAHDIENLRFAVVKSTPDRIYDYSLVIPETISIRDLGMFFSIKKQHIIDTIRQHMHARNERKQIKFYLTAIGQFKDTQGENFVRSFNHVFQLVLNDSEVETRIEEGIEVILMKEDELQRSPTGAFLDHLNQVNLKIVRYQPLRGGSSTYMRLPSYLSTKGVINPLNKNDNMCFMWSVLIALHHQEVARNKGRISHYRQYEDELNLKDIEFPFCISQIEKFERQNQIGVSVILYEADKILKPYSISRTHYDKHVFLLLYAKNEASHYCCIPNFDCLLADQNGSLTNNKYFCRFCFNHFYCHQEREAHQERCQKFEAVVTVCPDKDKSLLKFTNDQNQLPVPYKIICDFESLTPKVQTCPNNPKRPSTMRIEHQQPCSFHYVVIRSDGKQVREKIYRGENAPKVLLECLLKEYNDIEKLLKEIEPIRMTPAQRYEYENAKTCHICKRVIDPTSENNNKVRDHDHITGEYRGAAHNLCNLKFRFKPHVPVFFHNLKGYDGHLIMQGMSKWPEKLEVLAQTLEKYSIIKFGKLIFKDTLQFLNASLDTLVSSMAETTEALCTQCRKSQKLKNSQITHDWKLVGKCNVCKSDIIKQLDENEIRKKFKITSANIPTDLLHLVIRKGVYPYSYMTNWEQFKETSLPAKKFFYNHLTEEDISDVDYAHAKKVWSSFKMRTMGDYHDLYLKTDVYLLADIFQNFTQTCLKHYELDPAHYYTSPHLSWDACLKLTNQKLELLTDINMHQFIELGMRGGISTVCGFKYAKANNKYLHSYNPKKKSRYIIYLDANNLYGWAMCEALPTGGFRWLNDQEISQLDVTKLEPDSEIGYALEVDFEYPEELHDEHNDLPLAPERCKVPPAWLSSYQRKLMNDLKYSAANVPKLVPNLNDKKHYIVHYRNLQLYLSLGLKIKKIHRVLAFNQSAWMRPYIELNTKLRQAAKSDFEKDFFKLMNNSVFGKTMENVRKRRTVKFPDSEKKYDKLVSSPLCKDVRQFKEGLIAVEIQKEKVIMNKPVYVGFSVLELSKWLMYEFYYNKMKKLYKDKVRVLYTDTDSLMLRIDTEDVYADMRESIDWYDFANYDKNHVNYNTANNKVIGKMKDECAGIPIEEFVGLRSKLYAIRKKGDSTILKCKGHKAKKTAFEEFKECLAESKEILHEMRQMRSDNHEIYVLNVNKKALSSLDTKRWCCEDGITNLAFGHYATRRHDMTYGL
jgi:hypothetical protein